MIEENAANQMRRAFERANGPLHESGLWGYYLRRLKEEAGKAYRQLLNEDGFMDFYTAATPLDALEQSSIGSRPSQRIGTRTLDDLRAIPWVLRTTG